MHRFLVNSILIYEGTSDRVTDCRKLHTFQLPLKNYKDCKKGIPDISVTFSLSNDFLLTVTALDVTGGGSVTIPVDVQHGAEKEKIKQMRQIEERLRNSDAQETRRQVLIAKLEKMAQDGKLSDLAVWIEGNRAATFEVIEAKFNEAEKA